MKTTSLCLAIFAAAAAGVLPVSAGVFPSSGIAQTYDLPDGTTTLPDFSQPYGTVNGAFNGTIISVQNQAMKLSTFTPPAATTSTATRFMLPIIDTSKVISSFNVVFDLAISAPTADANLIGEGLSLNFGAIPGNAGNGETGFSGMANGLTIGWDTKDNGGEERTIIVYANGAILGQFAAADFPGAFIVDDTSSGAAAFRPVIINWDAQGLDITWNGVVICQNFPTPGFAPANNDRFAFSTRTSLANEDVSIDNLLVNTTAIDPLFTNGPAIWEFMARNKDTMEDDDFDHPDYIEIYNGQPSAVNMSGWYLTDDKTNLTKWQFPSLSLAANGYTYVFASGKNRTNAAHFHTNFTLPGEAGWFALVRPDGTIKSEVTYGPQYDDIPAGFKTAVESLGYLSAASPGKANTVIPATAIPITRGADVVTEEPAFTNAQSVPLVSGFITAAESVVIQPPVTPGAVVRYTTNATNPTETSTLYSTPIAVTNRSMAIRARVFATGKIPGPAKTLSLIFRNADLNNYRNTGKAFTSNLPVLVFDSFGVPVDSATDLSARPYRYTYGMLFDPAAGATPGKASLGDIPAISSHAGTHVRGQTSSGFPQRPYALEWWNSEDKDKDLEMLGMPADSDWVLYSPFNEESLMKNAVVYTTMMQWAGQGAGMRNRFVEVFFNQGADTLSYSDYRGVYLLVEKIKQSADRVNIEKLNEEINAPNLITGGYMWKKDKPPQVQTVSTSSTGGWGGQTWEVIDPNVTSTAQKSWLQTHLQQFDNSLTAANWQDPVNGYRKFADTASFIDNMLWVEAFKQIDGYRISTYFHKTRTGKIKAFPTWDFNLSAGNANYLGGENPAGWYYTHIGGADIPYWPRLLQDPAYVREHWDRFWKARRSALSTANVHGLIDQFSNSIRAGDPRDVLRTSRPASPSNPDFDTPASRQFSKWSVLGVYDWPNCNGYTQRTSYQSEVQFFKEWVKQRLEWMEFMSMDGNAGLPKMRPPNFHDRAAAGRPEIYKARVAPGFQLDMADPDGLAGAQIYYTTNGTDPRKSDGSIDPAAQTLPGAATTVNNFITAGSSWRYSASLSAYPAVQGALAWKDSAYDDTAWTQASAPFGYGESGLTTMLPAAVQPANGANQVTCFRRTFNVADPLTVYELILEINADDGVVVYLNDQEAARCNMPYGPAATSFTTRTLGVRDGVGNGEAENLFVPFRVNRSMLSQGTNTLAVEVHQFQYGTSGNPNSTAVNDMRFDLRLKGTTITWPATPVTLNSTGVVTVKARTKNGTAWSPVSEAEFVVGTEPASASNLVISELHYNPAQPTQAETVASGANAANDFEFFEIMNISASPVDLTGVAIADAVQFDFNTVPTGARLLAPGARAIVVENRAAFLLRYPGRENQILGEFTGGNLRNGGEPFTLTTNSGAATIKSFTWGIASPWPPLAAADRTAGGPDYSLVLNNPASNPDHNLGSSWRSSGVSRGNPGGVDSTPPPANGETDTDGDGLSDFAEWVFGENGYPVPTIEPQSPSGGSPGNYLVVRLPRNGSADRITVDVSQSEDLQTWTTGQLVLIGREAQDNRELLVYRSAEPVTTSGRLFVKAQAASLP